MGDYDWFYQVYAEDVRNSVGFIPVEQFSSQVEIKPGQVGQIRDLAVFDLPTIDIAMEMNQWLIQENERLKDEVEELQCDISTYHHSVQWLEGFCIGEEGDTHAD
jgi:hypothetical protein